MKDVPCLVYAAIPCTCGEMIDTSWTFNGKEIQTSPMWPCAGEAGKYITYHCYSCGKEIKKDISELKCEEPTTIGTLSYICDSDGNFSWKCPVHGVWERTVSTLNDEAEVYQTVENNGVGICCAAEMFDQQARMESAKKNGVSKCICCNRICPNDEVEKLAYKGEDDSFPRELAICEYCFENDDALACLSDRCYECGRCSLDEQFSQTSDFAKPYAMASKCFYIQNVDVDDDGCYLGFEIACHKTNQIVAEVESCMMDDEYVSEEFSDTEDYDDEEFYDEEDFE